MMLWLERTSGACSHFLKGRILHMYDSQSHLGVPVEPLGGLP
jgi:hypothetical protein